MSDLSDQNVNIWKTKIYVLYVKFNSISKFSLRPNITAIYSEKSDFITAVIQSSLNRILIIMKTDVCTWAVSVWSACMSRRMHESKLVTVFLQIAAKSPRLSVSPISCYYEQLDDVRTMRCRRIHFTCAWYKLQWI